MSVHSVSPLSLPEFLALCTANDAHLAKVKAKNADLKLRLQELETQAEPPNVSPCLSLPVSDIHWQLLTSCLHVQGEVTRRMSEHPLSGLESQESRDQLQQLVCDSTGMVCNGP